jgi:flagellar hook-length control protein FliK
MIAAAVATSASGPANGAPVPGNSATAGPVVPAQTADANGNAPSGAGSSQATADTHAVAKAVPRRDPRASGRSREGEPADFAALLVTSVPAEPSAAPVPGTTDAGERADPEPAPASPLLPDQLLALLAGASTMPAASDTSAARIAAPPTATGNDAMSAQPTPTTTASLRAPAIGDAVPAAIPAPASGTDAEIAPAGKPDAPSFAETLANLPLHVESPAPPPHIVVLPNAAAPDAATAAKASASAASTAAIAVPADPQAGFDDGFGARIAWLAEQRIGHAEIRLNPEHVGPIEVRVEVDGTRVNAQFHSVHAEVRQALEASVPRLRELLGQHGLQLGHADIGQRHGGQRAPADAQPTHGTGGDGGRDAVPLPVAVGGDSGCIL